MIRSSLKKIKPFLAMEILEELEKLKASGKSTISFSLGEPDLAPPQAVIDACAEALRAGLTRYTSCQGLLELRQEIALHYQKKYRVSVDPDQILVTSGTSPAMLLVFSLLLNPGDNVILSNPHYACYPSFIHYVGGRPQEVVGYEEEGFQYRPEAIQKKMSPKTKAILVNSPSNPTGNLLPEETLKAIADMGSAKRWIVSDEIYHELVYEGRERSILEFTDKAFVVNGFSKAYAMTGFRLGYVIAPKRFMKTLRILQQSFFISANSFVQKAGITALREGDAFLEEARRIFNERRLVMLDGLKRLGLEVSGHPVGAFYVLANSQKWSRSSRKLALSILQKTQVGITPGIDFGSAGEGYLRFSYATSIENIREGLRRLGEYLF